MFSRLLFSAAFVSVAGTPLCAATTDPPCSEQVVYADAELERLCLDVAYGPHPCQRLDAYLVDSDVPTPVLIELHGGAFWSGRKSSFGSYLDDGTDSGVIELALRHGISVISVNYRLSAATDANCNPVLLSGTQVYEPAHAFPTPHDDAALALEFVRARAASGEWNIDPTRIAAIGSSAGGTLALGLAFRSTGNDFVTARVATTPRTARGLRAVLALLAPTDFRLGAFELCPGGERGAWHFGATDLVSFRTDPLVLARRAAASPLVWIENSGVPREVRSLGAYLGDPAWTPGDVSWNGLPCTGATGPLALPTANPHAAAFGLLLEDALAAAGSREPDTLLIDLAACSNVGIGAATESADFLAGTLGVRPGYALSARSSTNAPQLSVFGRFEPGSRVTLWVRDATPGAIARLHLSPQACNVEHPGGVLVPGGPQATIVDLLDVDDCGFVSVELDPALLANGPLFAQVELVEGGPTDVRKLTRAWWLE